MTVLPVQNETEAETGWTFRGNGGFAAALAIKVRGVLSRVMESLNGDDGSLARPGDPLTFLCFRTAHITEYAVVDTIHSAEFNYYAPTVGILPARRAIADHLSHVLPYKLSPNDVYLVIGGTQAIEVVVTALARLGANILLSRPGYLCYVTCTVLYGLEVRYFNFLPDEGWEVNLERVEDLADVNTIAMVIINPGNLCTTVFSYRHMKEIAEMARELGIMVIADESLRSSSFWRHAIRAHGCFCIDCTRLDSGFPIEEVVESIIGFLNVSPDPATFVQAAIPRMLERTDEEFFSKVLRMLREAADICYDKIREVKLNSSLLEDVEDDLDFCVQLAREESIVVLPGITLDMKSWLCITFAVEPSSREDSLERMKALCQRHAKKYRKGSTCSSEKCCNL